VTHGKLVIRHNREIFWSYRDEKSSSPLRFRKQVRDFPRGPPSCPPRETKMQRSPRSCARYDSRELAHVRSYIRILRESLPLPSRKSFPSMHGVPLQHFFAFRSLLFALISCAIARSHLIWTRRVPPDLSRCYPSGRVFPFLGFSLQKRTFSRHYVSASFNSPQQPRFFRDRSRWESFRVSTRPNATQPPIVFSLRRDVSHFEADTLISDKEDNDRASIYRNVIVFHDRIKRKRSKNCFYRSISRQRRRSDRSSSRWICLISMYRDISDIIGSIRSKSMTAKLSRDSYLR